MFCGTDNIPRNTPHIQTECEEYPRIFHEILSVPQNTVMNLNNVMNYRSALLKTYLATIIYCFFYFTF